MVVKDRIGTRFVHTHLESISHVCVIKVSLDGGHVESDRDDTHMNDNGIIGKVFCTNRFSCTCVVHALFSGAIT